MATAVKPGRQAAEGPGLDARHAPADVFVAFGITGDLASVMTFHSLYKLERRGLLGCPIVGVAVDDWSGEDLRTHAHDAITPVLPYEKGSWGPDAANHLLAGHGRWHAPWRES